MVSTRVWTESEIKQLLLTSKPMVERSLLKMWDFQTVSEQATKETKYTNKVGFNKPDGASLSGFVENLRRYRTFKSDKQVSYVRRRLLKYTRQITAIANGELVLPKETNFVRNRINRFRRPSFNYRPPNWH